MSLKTQAQHLIASDRYAELIKALKYEHERGVLLGRLIERIADEYPAIVRGAEAHQLAHDKREVVEHALLQREVMG